MAVLRASSAAALSRLLLYLLPLLPAVTRLR